MLYLVNNERGSIMMSSEWDPKLGQHFLVVSDTISHASSELNTVSIVDLMIVISYNQYLHLMCLIGVLFPL